MHQSKSDTPAEDPDHKQYSWHRHPAFITALSAAFTLIGSVVTIVLGQSEVLPAAINPAPAPSTVFSTQTVTTTATAVSTVTVTETPTAEPSGTPVPIVAPGALAVSIKIGTSGKIGPNEWLAGSSTGANAEVFDSTGTRLNLGCYPTWVLTRGQTEIRRVRGTSCRGNGYMFNFGSDALKTPGTYQVSVSVITDGGSKGSSSTSFTVT